MTMLRANGKILARSASSGGGKNIYPTIADAIANASNIAVGTFFETNGFHTSGDGGAARYLVSDTGTANGMDIVQLAAGKLAVLQAGDWIVPEQLGYEQSYSRADVVPYITRAISMGCQHIHLRSSGNGAGYTWKTKLIVNVKGFKLTGEGEWGYPNKFSYVVFRPADASVTEMIELSQRFAVFEDIDFEVTGDYVKQVDGIICTTYNHDETRYWTFKNLRFNSFRRALDMRGGIKWHFDIENVLINACEYGIRFYESSTMLCTMYNVHFQSIDETDLEFVGNVYSCLCENCNFGIQKKAVKFSNVSSPNNYRYQNVNFTNCQFEIDNTDIDNVDAVVLDFCADFDQNVCCDSCNFTLIRNAWTTYPNIRSIKLANKTNFTLKNCTQLGADPEQAMIMPFEKMWNENSLPTDGSITLVGSQVQIAIPSQLRPYLIKRGQCQEMYAYNARTGNETAWPDCDTWMPEYSGQIKTCRVSTFENTAHMPTTGLFGYLSVCGVIDGANIRVMQKLEFTNNGNIYVRRGLDDGGFRWEAWKTITAQ